MQNLHIINLTFWQDEGYFELSTSWSNVKTRIETWNLELWAYRSIVIAFAWKHDRTGCNLNKNNFHEDTWKLQVRKFTYSNWPHLSILKYQIKIVDLKLLLEIIITMTRKARGIMMSFIYYFCALNLKLILLILCMVANILKRCLMLRKNHSYGMLSHYPSFWDMSLSCLQH